MFWENRVGGDGVGALALYFVSKARREILFCKQEREGDIGASSKLEGFFSALKLMSSFLVFTWKAGVLFTF